MKLSRLGLFIIVGVAFTISCTQGGEIRIQNPPELVAVSPPPTALKDPKIISVRIAKVQTLNLQEANPSEKDKRPVRITTYIAERNPERNEGKKTIRFSKLISKGPTSASNKPVKITVSLFEETKKKVSPVVSEVVLTKQLVPLDFENQVAVTEFEPMRMVETQDKVVNQIVLPNPPPPPALQYFQTHPELNYQYFTQPPQLKYYQNPIIPQNEVAVEPNHQLQEVYEGGVMPKLNAPSPLQHPQYNFAYRVHDSVSGTNHGHTEFRNGNVVHGRYALMDADGLLRTVSYTSDPVYGFNAVVNRKPPGNTVNHISPVTGGAGASYGYHYHGHGHPGFFSYSLR